MINKKLKAISSLTAKTDTVIDIGCDHAYLAIYLKKNNLVKDVYASDINKQALNNARINIQKANLNITTYLADGFKNIDNSKINTAIIAGVGANTILDIVSLAPKNITKFIISSNNHSEVIRKYFYNHKFYLTKEIVVLENNKYYPIMLFTSKYHKLSSKELNYGISNNIDYYKYLIAKEKEILSNIPSKKIIIKLKHIKKINDLKNLIKEKNGVDLNN